MVAQVVVVVQDEVDIVELAETDTQAVIAALVEVGTVELG